jgi:hypothetical protein
VVSFGHYGVVGDNILIHSLKTILMPSKILGNNKMKDIFDLDTELHPFNIAPSSMFIDLFSSLFEKDMLLNVD